jgi:hypothetical protein
MSCLLHIELHLPLIHRPPDPEQVDGLLAVLMQHIPRLFTEVEDQRTSSILEAAKADALDLEAQHHWLLIQLIEADLERVDVREAPLLTAHETKDLDLSIDEIVMVVVAALSAELQIPLLSLEVEVRFVLLNDGK